MALFNTTANIPELPSYTLTPRPDLINGIPDIWLQLLSPIVAYWVVSLFFHILDTLDLCADYRLHTPAEVSKRNKVSRYEVFRDVILQQVIQTIAGYGMAYFDPPEMIGKEMYDVAVWARRIRIAETYLPQTLALVGVNAPKLANQLYDAYPAVAGALAGGRYATAGFAAWELTAAKVIYHGLVPFLQFSIAVCIMDTWQYFLHRLMHMNKFLYVWLHSHGRGDLETAFRLLEDMEKKGIKPSIVTYNTIINGLCKVGRTSAADEFSKGILGDVVTYSTLLHGYIGEDNVKGILETKQRLEEAGVQMDVIMCNILIKALFMVGALEDARTLCQAMPEMNLVANSVTYGTMIDGYCKVGRIEEALEIFDEFRRMLFSSVACYNCMINGLCKKGMVDTATEVFIELNEKDLSFDLGICEILIKATFAKEGVNGILNFICRIENLQSETFDTICNYVICFLCKRGSSEVASEVYLLMRKRGAVVTSQSYYSILKGFPNDGKKRLIGPLLSIFVKENGLVEPMVSKIIVQYLCLNDVTKTLRYIKMMKDNSSTITVPVNILKKLIKDGKVLDAYKLVMGAKDNLPCMDVVDYTTMVAALCREGYISKALDLCAFARKKGITLNIVTYNTIIHSLCRQGCFVEAFRLFDSLERIDMVPTEVTYATLIDNLCKEGQLLDAKQLFDRMVLKGIKPSTRLYNSFIDGYCKSGQLEEAFKFLHDLETYCLEPDEFTVSAVIYGYCQKGDMEGALGFFFEFKTKVVSPDFLGFLNLVKGLCTKGRMEEARSILREMLQSKSVLELINRVDSEVESESVLNFLVSLCEQGSILEAVTVLNEIGSMFFPTRRFVTDHALGRQNKLDECESLNAVASAATLTDERTDLMMLEDYHNVGKITQFHDFNLCYSKVSSFCSKGKLWKANQLMKEMLSSFQEDS